MTKCLHPLALYVFEMEARLAGIKPISAARGKGRLLVCTLHAPLTWVGSMLKVELNLSSTPFWHVLREPYAVTLHNASE